MIHNIKSNIKGMGGCYLLFKGSTFNETVGRRGTNHLIEHLLCKSFDHILEDLDKDGINWNATTGNDTVKFYMTGLDEKISKYKNIMIESVLSGGDITQEQFDIEKKIVLEEYADCFNDHYYGHFYNLFRKKYNVYFSIGHKEDLQNYTFEQYLKDVKDYYSTADMIINVSDDEISHDRYPNKILLANEINKNLEHHDGEFLYDNINRDNKINVMCVSDVDSKDKLECDIILDILGTGLKSPLYQEIREKRGLSYFSYSYLTNVYDDSVMILSSTTSKENVDKLLDTYSMIFNNPDKYFTKERYNIVQGGYEVKLKKNDIFNYKNIAKLHNRYYNLDKLSNVSYEQCLDVYKKYFNLDKFYISKDTDFK
jgi:predicted Zn-dependent peptidase